MAERSWNAALVVRIVGFLIVYGVAVVATGNMDGGSGDNEGLEPYTSSTSVDQKEEPTASSPDFSKCTAVSDAIESSLLFPICIRYIPLDKYFIYDYDIDYDRLKDDLCLLNAALETSPLSSPYCMDLIRAYTCNYVYPGCSNETGLPQGICTEECQRYVLSNVCSGTLETVVRITKKIALNFSRQCDDPLLLLHVQDYGNNTESIPHSDCINITGTLTESLDPDPTEVAPAPTITESAASHALKIALPLISVILLTMLGVVLIIANICKARKDKKKSTNPLKSLTLTNEYLQSLEGNDHDGKAVSQGLFQLSKEDVHAFWNDDKLRKTLVSTDNLYITGELGEGAFGRVFKGLLVTEDPNQKSGRKIVQIAIKTVKNTQGMYRELKAFIEGSALMCSFNHPHILGMVGICLDTVQSPYLLLPYMANGDLRMFLKNKRDTSKSSDTGYPESLDYNLLVRMCYEVATGMEYLASKKLVHRDLAARNCMVDQDLSVKVADFGLARVIYHTDYYRQHQQMKVPVKWMAPESLHDMISTEKSDVWSYGIVCWEVFSLGRLPYPTLANYEVVDYLERGNRLKKPALCSDVMYEVMLKCWEDEAEKRPTFTEMVSQYHNGLIPGTTKAEQGADGYVLLGPEEKLHVECKRKMATCLSKTSVMDISMIKKDSQLSTPSAGTTFDVIFLNPREATEAEQSESDLAAIPDQECYMEMNSSWYAGASVLVNQAALHDYDNVAQDHEEEVEAKGREQDGHVTIKSDHMTAEPTHGPSSAALSNGSPKLHSSTSDYILMLAANNIHSVQRDY